jgi:homoserine kinase
MLQQLQQRNVRSCAQAQGSKCRAVKRARLIVAAHSRPVVAGGKVYLDPVKQECTAFAPATVANLGPGFDWLGCAVEVSCSQQLQ